MRATMMLALVAAGVCWVWWRRRRIQERHLRRLVTAAHGSATRGRVITLTRQASALVVAVAALGTGMWTQGIERLFWVHLPLALAVIVLYVPFATALAPPSFNVKGLRRTPEHRLVELGAPPEVARSIASAGKPFALIASVIFCCAVLVVALPHLRV